MRQNNIIIRQLGIQPYTLVLDAMHRFTESRTSDTQDELWLVQHPALYTQGNTGKVEHLLETTALPVIQSDRGGQITYHGPGQQIMYVLLDIKRRKLSVRGLVNALERSVIQTLQHFEIVANARADAPGVYVDGAKICSLGLRIRHGCSLHGLALNIDMDLTPFRAINPCGYAGLPMTQLKHLRPDIAVEDVYPLLIDQFTQLLGYRYNRLNNWSAKDYD